MRYEDWIASIPPEITGDVLWSMEIYRQALFLGDLTWVDVCKLQKDSRVHRLSDQLYRAVGSIGANIAEGFSYNSKKEQARYYEYALGSAREARHWYHLCRHSLGEEVAYHRIRLTVHIIRQLLKIVPSLRRKTIQETTMLYETNSQDDILTSVPLPEG